MATVDVVDSKKKSVGKVELADAIFGAPIKQHLFWEVVRWQSAARRQGSHSTRDRSEVSGGGRKPYRQKGTGNARHGTIREPQMRHGGIVFGPKPRDHSLQLPKKVRRAALRGALSQRLADGRLTVVDGLSLDAPKTKTVAQLLKDLGVEGSTLFVSAEPDAVLEKSARNIPYTRVLPAAGLNVYDVLRYDNLIILKDAVDPITERLQS